MAGHFLRSRKLSIPLFSLFLCAGLLLAASAFSVHAQETAAVQEIAGEIVPGEIDVFVLKDLKQGQVLYAALETTSGDLDPALSLVPASVNLPELIQGYRDGVQAILDTSAFPLAEIPALNDKTFLTWDDDGGAGYSAALKFVVPKDGDYLLGASGSLSSAGRITFGNYQKPLSLLLFISIRLIPATASRFFLGAL